MKLNASASNKMLDDEGFTFAVVPATLAAGGRIVSGAGRSCIGPPLYPVFGRPRSPPRRWPPELETTGTARVPLWRLLLVDRGPAAQRPADDDDLDLEPSETSYLYCPLCPGSSVAAASPPRCRKSNSTGSAVLRWRQRLIGRSHSDGKEKFVFLNAGSSSGSEHKGRGGDGGHDALSYYANGGGRGGGSGGRRRSFLPYKQDLVGLFANSTAFQRSYHPF
ncbi:hypothetical protein ABZP36_030811 [Zizania latifolia]